MFRVDASEHRRLIWGSCDSFDECCIGTLDCACMSFKMGVGHDHNKISGLSFFKAEVMKVQDQQRNRVGFNLLTSRDSKGKCLRVEAEYITAMVHHLFIQTLFVKKTTREDT